MNNNKFYIVIAFLISLVLAQYFSKTKETVVVIQPPNPASSSQNSQDSKSAVSKNVELKKYPAKNSDVVKPNMSDVMTLNEVLEKHKENQAKEFQAKTKRQVELILTDDGLAKLERNINSLSANVNMAKEDRGWRVTYQSENNPMASLGIMNNDLILYDLIETARLNPHTEKFIARLENIFESLQH